MIKCPSCGFENDDNCTFCAICGSSVTQDDFYVHNTTSNNISVDELNEKLITKENQKTKSFKKLDKATLAKEAAKIEADDTKNEEPVKEYKAKTSAQPQPKKQKADVKAESKPDNKADVKAKSNADTKADNKSVGSDKNTAVQGSADDSKLYVLLSKFLFDTKNSTKLFKQKDIDENCNLALISYIPFLFFVPMIIKPCSGYTRYHGIQGLTLFIVSVVLEFFDILLSAIFSCALNDMPAVILTIMFTVVINLSILLFISTGIANAVKGEARELPVIGKYKLLKQYIY